MIAFWLRNPSPKTWMITVNTIKGSPHTQSRVHGASDAIRESTATCAGLIQTILIRSRGAVGRQCNSISYDAPMSLWKSKTDPNFAEEYLPEWLMRTPKTTSAGFFDFSYKWHAYARH